MSKNKIIYLYAERKPVTRRIKTKTLKEIAIEEVVKNTNCSKFRIKQLHKNAFIRPVWISFDGCKNVGCLIMNSAHVKIENKG